MSSAPSPPTSLTHVLPAGPGASSSPSHHPPAGVPGHQPSAHPILLLPGDQAGSGDEWDLYGPLPGVPQLHLLLSRGDKVLLVARVPPQSTMGGTTGPCQGEGCHYHWYPWHPSPSIQSPTSSGGSTAQPPAGSQNGVHWQGRVAREACLPPGWMGAGPVKAVICCPEQNKAQGPGAVQVL